MINREGKSDQVGKLLGIPGKDAQVVVPGFEIRSIRGRNSRVACSLARCRSADCRHAAMACSSAGDMRPN